VSWDSRDAWLVDVGDGALHGCGEVCPLPGYSRESIHEVREELARRVPGTIALEPPPPAGDWPALRRWLGEHTGQVRVASVRFGLETALLDYWARRLAQPLWRLLVKEPCARRLATSEVVDPLEDAPLVTVANLWHGAGVRTVKLKVGRDFERELDTLRALRQRWPAERLRIRIDANGSWPAQSVLERLTALAPYQPEYVEEPCASWDGSIPSPVPLARDESLVEREPSAEWLAAERAVEVLVLKPMSLGGFGVCLAWAEAARTAHQQVVVSHLFDGPWALGAAAHLACAIQEPNRAVGLSRHRGLGAWRALAAPPESVELGAVVAREEPGLGVEPTARLSVRAAARECPQQVGLVCGGRELSYGALACGVRHASAWLAERGVLAAVRASERPVAFVAEPELGPLGLLYTCLDLGLPVLPLHPRLRPAERDAVLRELDPAVTLEASELDDIAAAFARGLDDAASSAAPPANEPPYADAPDAAESDLAWLLTSGSTGRPRAVRLSRRAFLASADASAACLGWRPNDRWLLSLPFAHVGGLSVLTRCLIARRTVVVGSISADPERWTSQAAEQQVTLLSLVPAQLARFLESGAGLPSSVRAILLGGAAAPRSVLEEARRRGLPVLRTYGLTEACSQVATERLMDLPLASGGSHDGERSLEKARPARDVPRPGLVGPLLPGVEVRIGEGDAIELRGDVLLSGYVGQGDPFIRGGWFRTSDRGRLRDGQLEVLGRLDHVIVTGGENVAPESVEAALSVHPGVSGVCVVGLPDATWGACVTALLVLRPGSRIEDVAGWSREHLSSLERPRRWMGIERLPELPSGKLDRSAALRLAQAHFAAAGS
jgi:O-succinylbenzoic acid--CoA ligase